MVEKTGDVEAKANLQPPFYIRKIDFKYPKGYCLLPKKDKEDTYWVHRNKTSNKNKEKLSPITPFPLINLRFKPL